MGIIKKLKKAGIKSIKLPDKALIGKPVAKEIVDPETGEILVEVNEEITKEKLQLLRERNIKEVEIVFIDVHKYSSALRDNL